VVLSLHDVLRLWVCNLRVSYQNQHHGSQMFRAMLSVALVEAGVAVMFFMHPFGREKRCIPAVCLFFTNVFFVLLARHFWVTDSFRLTHCGGYCS